jgi:transcriptional regulator with XRE-family HTH domain
MSDPTPHPVREILRALGYSLTGVARRTGIDRLHLTRVVNGQRYPDHETKIALVALTGRPITELFRLECLLDAYTVRVGRPPRPVRTSRTPVAPSSPAGRRAGTDPHIGSRRD